VEIVPGYIETMRRRLGRIAGDAQLYSGEMFPYAAGEGDLRGVTAVGSPRAVPA
jgi:hypothetical protein